MKLERETDNVHIPLATLEVRASLQRVEVIPKSMGIQELLELYMASAQGYIDEIRSKEGTARAANRHHSIAERIFKELKRRGAEKELLPLLSHHRPAVRLWAAVHTLGIAPDAALEVLEALDKDAPPTIRVYAYVALEDVRKGWLPR